MAGNLVVDSINGVNISVSPPATQAYANSLLVEYEVTGSPVTSIDFSDLDINTHKSYRVEVELVNATASNGVLYAFVNGDTIITNYYSQVLVGSGASASTALVNSANIADFSASQLSNHTIDIKLTGKSRVSLVAIGERGTITSPVLQLYHVNKNSIVTNVTQLTFTSSVVGAIGVGSKIRIYRGDV